MNSQKFCPPVLILTFNRPQYLQTLLTKLSQVKPEKIYISIDGPRLDNISDQQKQQQIRNLLNKINWKCQLNIRKSKKNLGCKYGVVAGINWFFQHELCGIILEDDCIPDSTFFEFCDSMLRKYEHKNQVMSIGGSNLFADKLEISESYFFTSFPQCWGWATWRRAWKKYDVNMSDWPKNKHQLLQTKYADSHVVNYWTKLFDKSHAGEIDTWDYQWVYTILKHRGLCINPTVNLVSNIGFDQDATHTKFAPLDQAFKPTGVLALPIKHLTQVKLNHHADRILQKSLYVPPKWRYYLGLILGTIKYRFLKGDS